MSGGPFTGLVFPRSAIGFSLLVPKLIGAYELELHDAVEARIAARPTLVVDVGSADGYYAIGFARRLPQASVIAFDGDPEARRLLRLCAEANGVAPRLDQRALATPEALRSLPLGAKALLFLDCEGAEDVLLDLEQVPLLRNTPIIVELHEHLVVGVGARIEERFRNTHTITPIDVEGRMPRELGTAFSSWPEHERKLLVDEGRPPSMSWLVMVPRGN